MMKVTIKIPLLASGLLALSGLAQAAQVNLYTTREPVSYTHLRAHET